MTGSAETYRIRNRGAFERSTRPAHGKNLTAQAADCAQAPQRAESLS